MFYCTTWSINYNYLNYVLYNKQILYKSVTLILVNPAFVKIVYIMV